MKQKFKGVVIPTLEKDCDIDIEQSVRKLLDRDNYKQRHINTLASNLTKINTEIRSKLNTIEMKMKILSIVLIWSDILIVLMITHVIK
jgi:hypothetical protein